MPLDAVFTHALCGELKPLLEGAKIDRVQQPERDMLLLSTRGKNGNYKLIVAAGNGSARVHITKESIENPSEPPMFCMLMRKHLVGARIASISQPDFERMLIMELDTFDEMGVQTPKKLIVEMIGKSSNVVLTGADGRIIDCMRRMDYAGDELRRMMPGMIYRLPPKQNKTEFFSTDMSDYAKFVSAADRSVPPEKWLLSTFSGLSPLVCRELAFRAGGYESLPEVLESFRETVDAGDFCPSMTVVDGHPADYCFMPVKQYQNSAETESFDNFSALLDAFYSRRDRDERRRKRSRELTHTVKTIRDRLLRKLSGQREELARTDSREQLRISAELVTSNIYRIKKGDRLIRCENYYDPECREIEIELDPLKTPQQNCTAMFREYNKLKAAKEHLTALIAQGEQQLDYLNSTLDEIERAENERDLAEIRRELIQTGYIKHQKGAKPEKVKLQQPLKFISYDGLEILVGRNNNQNDELTTKLARRTDYWLHTQKVHGSHVIIRCDGLEPPENTLLEAASLAAYYSQGRDAGKLPVDYTMVRNVKKPSGALPGKVIYTEFRTIIAQADETLVERIKK